MTTTILNKYSSSSSSSVGQLSGDGNELLMGEDKTDSVIPFDDHDVVVVAADASYYYSTEIVSETQISADQQLLMNNLLPCSHAYSSSDQDSITEKINLGDSPFYSKSPQESNGFRVKSRGNGRTKYGSDSLLTMILKERSRANAETAPASSLGGRQGKAAELLYPEYENPSFSGSSPLPSGLLSFSSGPTIPRSGSISQRSNSTASSNSFAFPILASEWNDSPVRMAEADSRKRLRKTRWWGTCFNCSGI